MGTTVAKQVAIPIVALVAGGLCTICESSRTWGQLMVYFGAQTGMNIYMKNVLSGSVVKDADDPDERLLGMPAPGMVTAIQQVTSFFLLVVLLLLSRLTYAYRYEPATLKTAGEWLTVVLFSCTFALNIALNNYSMALMALSINLIIRSCSTLATCISQWAVAKVAGGESKDVDPKELGCMLVGTIFAALAVFAKSQESKSTGKSSEHLMLGVVVCVVSLFCGALNMALAGLLGTKELNSIDAVFYMSVPAIIFLSGPIVMMPHPVGWSDRGSMTDWDVFQEVLKYSPYTLGLVLVSGALALCYNVLQYHFVQTLSATHIAFAGNFNKAATIVLAILVELDSVPSGPWGVMMMLCIAGNILSFTAYNVLKSRERAASPAYAKVSELELPVRVGPDSAGS